MERVRRAVAVEVENPPPELSAVEEPYRRIVEEVAAYVAERGRLEKEKYNELYRRFRKQYPLPAQLIQQAMNQGVETGKSFLQQKKDGCVHKPRPEVGQVSRRFAKDSWSYKKAVGSVTPVRLALSLPGGGREVWIKPHRRFWLYWWKVLSKEAELASTLILKRRRNKWYAIFVFDLAPKKETPAEVVAFDVNENWVAVARLCLLSTVDAVARWNRRYIDPTVYSLKTDFGRLAKRYEAVRNAKLEELKQKYPFAGRDDEEKLQKVTDTRLEGLPHPYPPQTWCYTSSIPQPSQSESLWPWHSRHRGTRAGDHASGQSNPAGINPPLHQAMARTAIAVRNRYWSTTRPPRHWCGATRR